MATRQVSRSTACRSSLPVRCTTSPLGSARRSRWSEAPAPTRRI